MFYIKGDDMEEMFRKAAEEYELNETIAADWDSVYVALQDDAAPVISTKKEKKGRKYFLVWMILAIGLISLLTYKTGFYSGKKQNEKPETVSKKSSMPETGRQPNENTIAKNNKPNSLPAINNASTNSVKNDKKISIGHKSILADNYFAYKKNTKTSDAVTPGNFLKFNKELQNNNSPIHSGQNLNKNNQSVNKNAPDNYITNNNQPNNKIDANLNNKTTVSQQSSSKQKIINSNYTRQSFAYIGLTGNADISFVNFQKASPLGYGIGIMGGYHFKNGISLETGLLYDKKNYYTKGEYFDKKDLPYLQYVDLLSANGNCNMWEIPLNFKYDFNTQKKHNFFVTAGLSSYLMNKEFYNFKYEKNGVPGEQGYDYYHSSQNWFSVLNLGGGINIKTGNRYFLQVQPYYKVPLTGVGKGSLSLSSAGINLSLTKRLK